MNRPASFIYYGESPRQHFECKLYFKPSGTAKYWVEIESYPELTRRFALPDQAVATFGAFREMSMKDWGASEVDWGGYNHLKHYWPEHLSPHDVSL